MERFWQQLHPRFTGQMAIDAAKEVDAITASLSDEKTQALTALGKQFMLARGNHRKEHVDQIEEGLGR